MANLVARHVAADHLAVGLLDRRFVHDLAVGNDQHAIGQFQNLVEVFRDQQHRRARDCALA